MSGVLDVCQGLTGTVLPFAGIDAPNGWLMCSGQAVDRETYPNLFRVIGSIYNTGGEAESQFRVPDLRGRVVAGTDNMGGAAANVLTTAVGINGVALGATGGSQVHTLTAAQMPAHTHDNVLSDLGHSHANVLNDGGHVHGNALSDPGHAHANSLNDPGHTHGHNAQYYNAGSSTGGGGFAAPAPGGATISAAGTGMSINNAGAGTGIVLSNAGAVTGMTISNAAAAVGVTITNVAQGSGDPHPLVQPTMVLNHIIKT